MNLNPFRENVWAYKKHVSVVTEKIFEKASEKYH